MRVLGIETSCDETAAAIVRDGTQVLCNVIATSRAAFSASGGVIPEEAARKQIECIVPVLEQAIKQHSQIDAIAVTRGPGLLGSLLIGTTTARVLASVWKKPLIGVHHTLGHLSSTWLAPLGRGPSFPVLTLSASGGHTDLWYRTSHTRGRLLGATRDDAAGEAFDKGASQLSLPYPGGPAIARAAEGGDPHAFSFPLPLHDEHTLDFSFSGLKTSLKYLLRDMNADIFLRTGSHVAASYQHALCAHLVDRILRALESHPETREVHLVGGVSANLYLRDFLRSQLATADRQVPIRTPAALEFCTDNAAMIASAGHFMAIELGDRAYAPFETVASLPLAMAASPVINQQTAEPRSEGCRECR